MKMGIEIVNHYLTIQEGKPNPDYVEINLGPTRIYIVHRPTGRTHQYVGSDHINKRSTGEPIEGEAKTEILVEALLRMIQLQLSKNKLQT